MKSALTIKYLLTMSSGFVWNEDVPYDNPGNSEIRMVKSPDPVKSFESGFYGYQFWIFMDTVSNKTVRVVSCVGNGDQRIFFDKDQGTVVVVNAGNYNKWNIRKNAAAMMREYISPAIAR